MTDTYPNANAPKRMLMNDTKHATPVYENRSGRDGPTAMIVGGMHGIEPVGWITASRFANAPLNCGNLVVIPYAANNAINEERYSDNDIGNLNRQFPPDKQASSKLARQIWREADRYNPDVFFDLHSSSKPWVMGGSNSRGQKIFATEEGMDQAEDACEWVNEYYINNCRHDRDLRFKLGNPQGDRDEPLFVDRVGWLVGKPGHLIETGRAGTTLDERVEWTEALVGRLLRAEGICAGF